MNLFYKITNLGVSSGLPKYMALVGIFQTSVLLIPEQFWLSLGFGGIQDFIHLPNFLEYYIQNSTFKTAMFLFWVCSPFSLLVTTYLCIAHLNNRGYDAYLSRRKLRLARSKYSGVYAISGFLFFILLYFWGTFFYLGEPLFLGSFVPVNNRIAMIIVHGSAICLILPMVIAVIVTELRASFHKINLGA